ncbi:MAG: hypothetical protein DRI65_06110 [Chloroflexota bacterium]|nr:MAG: hypothetical protein DRI65_06110 [Chloroflexota bacterium]
MFGTMHIRLPDYDAEMDPATWNLMLGLRGAHDHRFARGLTIGSQVTVCSNLCFSGDIGTFQTKQTTNIAKRLPPLVNEAVSKIPFHAEQQQAAFGLYEGYSLEKPQGDAILLDLYRQNVLSPSQLGRSVGEWDEPTHDYGANVYTLFNGCTEALKPTGQSFSPELHMQRSQKLTQILDDVVGL